MAVYLFVCQGGCINQINIVHYRVYYNIIRINSINKRVLYGYLEAVAKTKEKDIGIILWSSIEVDEIKMKGPTADLIWI
jgi:hypothetical protein